MNKKLWLVVGLLALMCVLYFVTRASNTSTETARPTPAAPSTTPVAATPKPSLSRTPSSIQRSEDTATTVLQHSTRPAVPAPVTDVSDTPAIVQLWQIPEDDASVDIDGVPGVRLQVNPDHLRQLRLGQTLILDIPDSNVLIESELTDTYNDPGGVQVWQGHINGEVDEAAVIVSRGKTHTHLIIASEQGNYSVVINNQTGESTFIDEGIIQDRQAPIDDAVYVDQPDSIPLPSIQ